MAALPQPLVHTALAIDEAYVAKARNGDSMGVPMSQVIHPCDRALWYAFRWAAFGEVAAGSRQRRFETGNLYERRLLDMLRMIGCEVVEIDETTGQQARVALAGGHLRGKLDGLATGLPEAPKACHVVECKTANDRAFKAIAKAGLREGKPEHFAQLQLYMHGTGVHRGLYMLANKNDDGLFVERVAYDPTFCLTLIARIERIVACERPPARLHDDPNAKGARECGWCSARAICHEGALARRNCRTCLSSTPLDGPRWSCAWHQRSLSYSDMQAGCPGHLFIPDLVPGEQIDADHAAGTVTYRMADGAVWVDGNSSERSAA